MTWQGALRARLLAALPVTTLVGQRVTWVERPQLAALPAVTLQAITEARPQHMGGFDGLNVVTVQVDAWATSHAQASALANAALDALIPANSGNGISFTRGFLESMADRGERVETTFVHRAQMDLRIHYSTL